MCEMLGLALCILMAAIVILLFGKQITRHGSDYTDVQGGRLICAFIICIYHYAVQNDVSACRVSVLEDNQLSE